MGFFSDLGNSLLGIQSRKENTSTSGRATQQTQLRDLTTTEQGIYDTAANRLMGSLEGMGPEAAASLLEEARQRLFRDSAEQINTTYNEAAARDYSNAASRGVARSSAGDVRADRRTAMRGRDLGLASDRAALGAEQILAQRREDRRREAAALMDHINAIWNQRLQGSKVVSTQTGTTSGLTQSNMTIGNSLMQGLGSYAAGSSSPFLSRFFGGGNSVFGGNDNA